MVSFAPDREGVGGQCRYRASRAAVPGRSWIVVARIQRRRCPVQGEYHAPGIPGVAKPACQDRRVFCIDSIWACDAWRRGGIGFHLRFRRARRATGFERYRRHDHRHRVARKVVEGAASCHRNAASGGQSDRLHPGGVCAKGEGRTLVRRTGFG